MSLDVHQRKHTDISDVMLAVIANGMIDSAAAIDGQVPLRQMVTSEAEILKEIHRTNIATRLRLG